ncbi:hypothetical protein ACG3SL_13005 [Sphingomonas sp. CJ20]
MSMSMEHHHHAAAAAYPGLVWLFLIAVAVSVVALVRADPAAGRLPLASREAQFVHIVMNGAMALHAAALGMSMAMIGLWGLAVVLALRLCWLGLAHPAMPRANARRERLASTGYHLFSTIVMLFAMQVAGGLVGYALALLFMLDAGATVLLAATWPKWAPAFRRDVRIVGLAASPVVTNAASVGLWLATVPHVVMDIGMVSMLR